MRLLLGIFLLIAPFCARADELYEVNMSVRALGMGNAYTPVVADKDSLFYNPAGLAKVSGLNITLLDAYAGANGQDIYDTYTDFTNSSSTTTGFASQIKSLFGKNIWLGFGGKAAVAVPNFAIAFYDTMTAGAYLTNPAYPNLSIDFINDYGLATGFAFNLVPKIVTMGLVGKKITRIGSSFPIGVSTLANLSSDQLQDSLNNRGSGYSLDYGVNFVLPTPVSPTFSFVWKNIGYTSFTQEFGSRAPPMIRDEMIAGFGMTFGLPGLDIRPAMDFKYVNRYDEALGKKIHLGVEFDFPFFKIRGGFHQGYYTAGIGMDMWLMRLDAATYGVELGEYPGQHEDRRYVLEMTMELSLDPSFSFLSGGGGSGSGGSGSSSKRIKQRR